MDKQNLSFEPMDVDISVHSNSDMDISQNEVKEEIYEFIRKINNSITSMPLPALKDDLETLPSSKENCFDIPVETVSSDSTTKIKVGLTVLVLLFSAIAFQISNIHCCDDFNLVKLRKNLSDKLYGQTKAIDALIDGLAINETKILIMYGSTGVGKTLATSILLEHLGSHTNVYHYTMPSFMQTFTTDFMLGLTVCKNTIVIVDDLNPSDLDVKIHIDNLISKTENWNKVVTVLLIYNHCSTAKDFKIQCDETFPVKIMESLKQIKAYKRMIQFEILTVEHLRKCVKTELGRTKIPEQQLEKLLKNFDVTIDGCKAVHSKMKLLDIS